MVERVLAKDKTGVRFSLPAFPCYLYKSFVQSFCPLFGSFLYSLQNKGPIGVVAITSVDNFVDMLIKDIANTYESCLYG